MATERKKSGTAALVLQLLISLLYSAMLVHMTIILLSSRMHNWTITLIAYLPQLVIIIASVVLQFTLRIRHRSHTQEGSLLPLLFSFIALEATYIFPLYQEVTDITVLSPSAVIVIARFAMLGTAVIFVFASVQFYGVNNTRNRLYLTLSLLAAAFLSIAAPINTDSTGTTLFASSNDTYIAIALIVMYIIAALTYIVAVVKDRATHTPGRAFSYILLMSGNLISLGTDYISGTIAIILYLNQKPLEPRERDYAYAGSFYAFAIWIGLGMLWLYDLLRRRVFKTRGRVAAAIAFVVCASVPTVLAVQNWDDHDRSHRYVARDMGYNYLSGVLPNGIIIDYGDNDTFPLWYNQEVEGVRTDVRVMNSSYIGGDWYIDQMRMKANESEAIPHSMPRHKYYGDATGQFIIREIPKADGSDWTAQEVMEVINSDDPRTQLTDQEGNKYNIVPARRIAVPVNKENVIRSGIVRPEDADLIEDTIYLNIDPSRYALVAGDVVFLDMLASGDWTRPIHFTSAADLLKWGLVNYDSQSEKGSWSYLQQDGMTYRLVPIKSPIDRIYGVGRIDTETLYDNLMNKYRYGNIRDPRVYVDYFVTNTMLTSQLRSSFARLANALTAEGDTTRAIEVVDRAMTELPLEQLRMDDMVVYLIEAYYRAGAYDKGNALAQKAGTILTEYVDYYSRFKGNKQTLVENEMMDRLRMLYNLYLITSQYGQTEVAALYAPYVGAI